MDAYVGAQVRPLFWVEASIESHSHSRIEYRVKVRAQFKSKSVAHDVVVKLPVPADVSNPQFKAPAGTAVYCPEEDSVRWTIKQFPGGKEYSLRAQFFLPSITSEEGIRKAPVQLSFEIPYFTVSGIQVRYLKIVERSNYQALPWVRYLTKSGDYQFRM